MRGVSSTLCAVVEEDLDAALLDDSEIGIIECPSRFKLSFLNMRNDIADACAFAYLHSDHGGDREVAALGWNMGLITFLNARLRGPIKSLKPLIRVDSLNVRTGSKPFDTL